MREIVIRRRVYRFSELKPAAKEHAKVGHRLAGDYSYRGEVLDSLKALAEHFHSQLVDYSIDWTDSVHSEVRFREINLTRATISKLLGELGDYDPATLKGVGDCKLTGVCFDEDAIDGFRKCFLGGEDDVVTCLQAAFVSVHRAAVADYWAQYEDEEFAEMCEANDYEFYENGDWYSG